MMMTVVPPVVGPETGPLTVIVSQDPMYVTFPVSQREFLEAQRTGEQVDVIDQIGPELDDPARNDSFRDQEPQAGRASTGERGHDVDSRAVGHGQRQHRERVPEQHEEWIAGRVWKAEHFRGGHVFARIPHRHRRSERQQIEDEYERRRYRGGNI